MSIIERFHRDERAHIIDWIVVLIGLFFIAISYSFTLPLNNILISIFAENGAPMAQMLLIRNMVVWAFCLLGVGLIVIGLMSAYRKTYDQGIIYSGWK